MSPNYSTVAGCWREERWLVTTTALHKVYPIIKVTGDFDDCVNPVGPCGAEPIGRTRLPCGLHSMYRTRRANRLNQIPQRGQGYHQIKFLAAPRDPESLIRVRPRAAEADALSRYCRSADGTSRQSRDGTTVRVATTRVVVNAGLHPRHRIASFCRAPSLPLVLGDAPIPSLASLEQIELTELAMDGGRVAGDSCKLLSPLRASLVATLAELKGLNSAALQAEGSRSLASFNLRTALDQLRNLLRDGFNFVQGLGSYQITEGERLAVLTSYGWESGLIGTFTDARVESLANEAINATPTIANPAHRYPAALVTLIQTQLDLVNQNRPTATGGAAQASTTATNNAVDRLPVLNSRVRFYYCSASNDLDQTDPLKKISRQPCYDAGDGTGQPLPGAAGTATFDAATLTLTLPVLPNRATSLRAFRQPTEGTAEPCGTLTTTTVSVVGHNSRGDGPESNHLTHVAT